MRSSSFRHTWQALAGWGILLAGAMYLLMPWQPAINMGIDYAWTLAEQVAYLQGLQYGRDILFTYGPWGFVEQAPYYPATRHLVLVLNVLLILLWTTSIWLTAGRWISHRLWVRTAALLGVVIVSLAINPWFTIVFSTCFVIVMTPCRARFDGRLRGRHSRSMTTRARQGSALGWMGLMVFAGIASQMKLTYAVTLAGVIASQVITTWLGRNRKASVVLPFMYAMSWLIAWCAMGQSLTGIGAYWAGAVQIIGSYSDAVSFPGPAWQGVEMVAVTLCLLMLALRLAMEDRQISVRWVRAAAAAGLLFILYKSGMVRQDDGHLTLAACAMMGIGILAATRGLRLRRGRWKSKYALVALAVIAPLVMGVVHGNRLRYHVTRVVGSEQYHRFIAFVMHGDQAIHAQWEHERQEVRKHLPLGSYDLATDVYPTRLDIAIWSGLPMAMRPTMQSYVAANEKLLRMNARHLEGADAPRQVVLSDEAQVDHQYPAFADSFSWPALLTHYDLARRVGDHLVLRRNAQARPTHMEPLGKQMMAMGTPSPVPGIPSGAQGLWATIRIKPTLWGKLRDVAYKRPVMIFEVMYDDGGFGAFRFIPGVAAAGFLLSPQVDFGKKWIDFATGQPLQGSAVKAIRIHPLGEGPDWPSYESQIEIEYWSFHFEPQPGLQRSPVAK